MKIVYSVLRGLALGLILFGSGLVFYDNYPDYSRRGDLILIGNDQPALILYTSRDIFHTGRVTAHLLHRDNNAVWHEVNLPVQILHELPAEFTNQLNGQNNRSTQGQN